MDSMFKGVFATEKELIDMVADIVELCQLSGCSLLEMLYAINEELPDDKRHTTTDEIVEMLTEQLTLLAEAKNA